MQNNKILLYGANGYTGQLFARYLMAKGIKPILAGRSDSVNEIGTALNLSTRVFNIEQTSSYLEDIDILVNLAGPFSITQDNLIKACIRTKTHYMDIAGEMTEVEQVFNHAPKAKAAKIALVPAAGFGVVPTDVAAKWACDLLEAPTHLTIAYSTVGGASRGTLKTVLKNIQTNGHILVEGEYRTARPAQSQKKVRVLGKSFNAVYNPWRADLFTAQLSTGVANIETYSEFPGFVVKMMNGRLIWLRNLILNRLIHLLPEGPSEKQIRKGCTYIRAIASNAKGETASVEIKGPEAYQFTVMSLYQTMRLVLEKENTYGFLTPSMLGTDWLLESEEVETKISRPQ